MVFQLFQLDKDKRTATYVTDCVNGLPFNAQRTEGAVSSNRAPDDLVALYIWYRTRTRNLIGYKGGQVERDLLGKLKK